MSIYANFFVVCLLFDWVIDLMLQPSLRKIATSRPVIFPLLMGL